MPIISKTPKATIAAYIAKGIALRKEALINNMIYLGEHVVKLARTKHLYMNQTGNLASSVGYAVVVDGKVHKQSTFKQIKKGTDGVKEGISHLEQLIAQQSKGISLIVVAGMPYAQYVEAKSLDVLDTAEQTAKKKLYIMLKKLNARIQ